MDGGGDPHHPELAGPFGRDWRRARPGGTGARRRRGQRIRRHALAPRATPGVSRVEAMNAVAGRSPLGARELGRVTDEEIVDALLQCESEPDFRDRL